MDGAADVNKALSAADVFRRELSPSLDAKRRKSLGQFMTPGHVAQLLASYFAEMPRDVRLLDPGAGMGALTAAFVAEACARAEPPRSIAVTCFEVDGAMALILAQTLAKCADQCAARGIEFRHEVVHDDYILRSAEPLLAEPPRFNCAILNPPYGKIRTSSPWRAALRSQSIETVNLYTAFVALAVQQLEPLGQLVAITPRSFCNGSYYEPFRRLILSEAAVEALHVFESRRTAFKEDEVLQENVVFSIRRGGAQASVTLSTDQSDAREVPFSDVVRTGDQHAFIRLPVGGGEAAAVIQSLPCTLADLGLTASTGRVVDFRAREHLRADPGPDTVPLIYPGHFSDGQVIWPRDNFKKPNALADCDHTASLVVPAGTYVLTKRFSAKEERRRVVAALYTGGRVGFENHLNYFHIAGAGLPERLARGLSAFLNSEAVDQYFRIFSGHTQVNATDLRNLHFPTLEQLEALAEADDVDTALRDLA